MYRKTYYLLLSVALNKKSLSQKYFFDLGFI